MGNKEKMSWVVDKACEKVKITKGSVDDIWKA